jgi:hypothetical protein
MLCSVPERSRKPPMQSFGPPSSKSIGFTTERDETAGAVNSGAAIARGQPKRYYRFEKRSKAALPNATGALFLAFGVT